MLERHVGHTNYVATGGSFRTAPNTTNACSVATNSTATVSGIPATASIRAVYLYWVGSGAIDNAVTLNGNTVTAERTDTAVFGFNGTNYDFFTGFAEISTEGFVSGNGTYTLSGLSVATGNPYCGVQVVTAGWALYVVYDDPNEPLHAVNIFDGFQFFRASSINLTASGFRIPADFISGRFTFATYDGDPQNSGAINGFAEALRLNGTTLDDGITPPASNPALQPYDGTINAQGISTSHGVDIDTYDVTNLLATGDTQATVTMSAGGDLVLSTGMIIAVNTEPLVDLGIASGQSGFFTPGQSAQLSFDVSNSGPEEEPNDITVSFDLPVGLSYTGASGGSWVCTPAGQTISCVHPGVIPNGGSLATLEIDVDVDSGATGVLDVTATVSSNSVDQVTANDQTTESITIVLAELGTSEKLVVDLNGGDADPGDILRYTIRINESAGAPATGLQITDDLPALIQSFVVVSIPAGAIDNSVIAGGANGTGLIDISNVDLAPSASADIVFDVIIAAGAPIGAVISNQATITNPDGPDATPIADNVIVSESQINATGSKTLYLYGSTSPDPNGFNNGAAPYLSRTPPQINQGNVPIDKTQPPVSWRLTPQLQDDLTIGSGSIPVSLYLSKGGANGNAVQRQIQVALSDSSGPIGSTVTLTLAAPPSSAPGLFVFNLPLASDRTVASGETITLTLTNVTPGGGTRRTRVFPVVGANFSRVDMNALTVINVDTVTFFDAPAPAGVEISDYSEGDQISIRASISDPFGSFDIASANLNLTDPAGTVQISNQTMTRGNESGNLAEFEFLYTLPANAVIGNWTAQVTGIEGVEGIVTHTRNAAFTVITRAPQLSVAKTVATESDPINGASNPFNIPGAIAIYTITVSNSGNGSPDPDSVTIRDAIPSGSAFVVDASLGDFVAFQDGAISSGLGFTLASDVSFSSQPGGGAPFDYTPVDSGNGTDPLVTGLQIAPSGQMNAANGSTPAFIVRFRVQLATGGP